MRNKNGGTTLNPIRPRFKFSLVPRIVLGFVSAAVLICAAGSINSARADYIPPMEHDGFTVLEEKWEFIEGTDSKANNHIGNILATHGPAKGDPNKAYTLELDHGGKKLRFPIDRFMLAHYTDSNTICTGNYLAFTEKYLEELRTKKPRTELLVRLASVGDKKAPPTVVGVWSFNAQTSWDKAIQQGSHALNLSAEKVRALGSAAGYKEALLKQSKKAWSEYDTRQGASR